LTVPASLRQRAPHDTAKVCPAAEVGTKALASTPRSTDRTLKRKWDIESKDLRNFKFKENYKGDETLLHGGAFIFYATVENITHFTNLHRFPNDLA
jgi:hypothetical protein